MTRSVLAAANTSSGGGRRPVARHAAANEPNTSSTKRAPATARTAAPGWPTARPAICCTR